jgi:omega-6 fatty acid desaturase (delta-12 desaturase)
METTVKDIRAVLPEGSRSRSSVTGVALFCLAASAYCASFAATTLSASWNARLVMSFVTGLAAAILFVVGHDACHGSLTPNSRWNAVLGRIAFLPSLHPFAAWEYSHNALHHGWTNLRGKDPVYCPRTVEEFRSLSPMQQRIERAYRSWIGLLPLYLVTIWWRLEISPSREHRIHIDKRGTFRADRGLVAAFAALQTLVVVMARGQSGDGWLAILAGVCLSVVVPFLVFAWLIGFATFQHHTHQQILWYGDEDEWTFFRAQVQSTVHVEFPRWIELMLNNIMEHTAHHVDPRVPLYRLTGAQDALENAFGEENIIKERFSFAGMSRTFRMCQLYDFEEHRWLTFDGVPTTASKLVY